MFKLRIETVPHQEQAYETLGDYGYDEDGTLWIKVSELGDWRYEFLVGIHEAIEFQLLRARGIKDPGKFTEAFDLLYEEEFAKGNPEATAYDEPGFCPSINGITNPYLVEHTIADFIEHALAVKLGVNLEEYYKAQERLYHPKDEGGGC